MTHQRRPGDRVSRAQAAWGDVLGVVNTVRNVKIGDRMLFERDVHAVAGERTEDGTGL